ncbi:MAG: OmpA family protein [FCB group bacterium]|jgi:outer membrane protein OmpA-like peptidoglycan-associated protein
MKEITLKIQFIILVLILNIIALSAQDDSINPNCKIRLPQEINGYQPALIPVLTLDGKYLYFDRKWHPENIGGVNDQDDIWYSVNQGNGNWSVPINIKSPLNTKGSDVLFSITPDGTTALIYSNYMATLKEKKSGFLFSSHLDSTIWSKPVPLNIEKFYNDSLHFYASLSCDKKIIIFSINRIDSYGGLDLYVSFFNDSTNIWSEPLNLGNTINSKGSEESPFLAYDNRTLYFSSDGMGGFGGLDLFMTRRLDDTWKNWSPPVNLGKYINSPFDENSIWLNATSDSAYIVSKDTSSKRSGIYIVCLPKELRPYPYTILQGKIFSENNKKVEAFQGPVQFKISGNISKYTSTFTSIPGKNEYLFVLPYSDVYNIKSTSKGYIYIEYLYNAQNNTSPEIIARDLLFVKAEEKNPMIINFDFDDATISDSAKYILEDFFANKNKYSQQKITIIGYTDSVGTEEYNLKLSYNRAKNTALYLEKLGANKNNIKFEGKGKANPKYTIDSENRRVEIYIEE